MKEENWIKNPNMNSLHHRVDQAHGLDIALDAQSDTTNDAMNIDENLVKAEHTSERFSWQESPGTKSLKRRKKVILRRRFRFSAWQ